MKSEIKRKPLFNYVNGEWILKTSGCPLCHDGMMEELLNLSDRNKDEDCINYVACDECHCVVSWYPYRTQPRWRVLQ